MRRRAESRLRPQVSPAFISHSPKHPPSAYCRPLYAGFALPLDGLVAAQLRGRGCHRHGQRRPPQGSGQPGHRLPLAGAVPGRRQPSPVPPARRRAAGVAVAAGAGTQLGGTARAGRGGEAGSPTGTIADLKHVVILMQENRSFDHYYGSLRGVRGFADKQALKYPNGTTIFEQPDTARTDLGYLLPFHMDSSKVNAQNAGDLDHSWAGDHSARNNGLWNNWVPAKTEQTMGYFTRADIPFQYALADAFTICDGYHQSILGPTSPNRMYFWTGTSGGWSTNPDDYTAEFPRAPSPPTPSCCRGRGSPGRSTPTTRSGTAAASTAGSATTATTRCGSTSSTRPRRTRPRRRGRNWPSAARSSPGCPTPACRSARTTSTTCWPSSSPTPPRAPCRRSPGSWRRTSTPSTRRRARATAPTTSGRCSRR